MFQLLHKLEKKITEQILVLGLATIVILALTPGLPKEGKGTTTLIIILIVFVLAILLWIIDKLIQYRYRQNILRGEEEHWINIVAQAETIFEGIKSLDMAKVANAGTTREIDEILDFYVTQNPTLIENLMNLFIEARDVATDSHDREIKEQVREFISCYFVTSNAIPVHSMLLEQNVREQLSASALTDGNVYVRTQLVRALANTIQKSNGSECIEFVERFIKEPDVLISGYAYVFSKECDSDGVEGLQRAWEDRYQDTNRNDFYRYMSHKNRRLRYIAAALAGHMNDEPSKVLLENLTRDEYDYVRQCSRNSLARRKIQALLEDL